jgi:hypothetical protein
MLVLRAAFVPDGEQPPPEFAADFSPLKFRATLYRTTGVITCENVGMTFGGDIRAEWHPDVAQGSEEGGDPGEKPIVADDDGTKETHGKNGAIHKDRPWSRTKLT